MIMRRYWACDSLLRRTHNVSWFALFPSNGWGSNGYFISSCGCIEKKSSLHEITWKHSNNTVCLARTVLWKYSHFSCVWLCWFVGDGPNKQSTNLAILVEGRGAFLSSCDMHPCILQKVIEQFPFDLICIRKWSISVH